MSENKYLFDVEAFYRTLDGHRTEQGMNWKEVAVVAKVNTSTLSRMASGSKPDADSLASLAAWAGINPADFSSHRSVSKSGTSNTLVRIASTLREDPNLTEPSRIALEEMIKAAYAKLAETRKST